MEEQFNNAHPELRVAVGDIYEKIASWGYEPICITDVNRTKQEQVSAYMLKFLNQGIPPSEARKAAELRRTFHWCGCAVDFRSSGAPYTRAQEGKILIHLRAAYPPARWEVLLHNVSSGVHFHLAIKDWARLQAWEKLQRELV